MGGEDVGASDAVALRRGIGYVIQETGLFPHMTVERNAGMALELAGRRRQRDRGAGREVLGLVGMDFGEFRGRYPWQLRGTEAAGRAGAGAGAGSDGAADG